MLWSGCFVLAVRSYTLETPPTAPRPQAECGARTDRIMDHTGHKNVVMVRVYTRRSDYASAAGTAGWAEGCVVWCGRGNRSGAVAVPALAASGALEGCGALLLGGGLPLVRRHPAH